MIARFSLVLVAGACSLVACGGGTGTGDQQTAGLDGGLGAAGGSSGVASTEGGTSAGGSSSGAGGTSAGSGGSTVGSGGASGSVGSGGTGTTGGTAGSPCAGSAAPLVAPGGVPRVPAAAGACHAGLVCDLPSCDPAAMGTCVEQPAACTKEYAPVCGCDGVTYGNDCQRLAAGAAKARDGECGQPTGQTCGGIAALPCPAGQTCDVVGCYPDAGGTCAPQSDACVALYQPVCGCDGVTHANDCERTRAGAAKSHDGACP